MDDKKPMEDVFNIEECKDNHKLCRECAVHHILTQIEELNIPVKCPQCKAESKTKKKQKKKKKNDAK